MTPPLAVVFDLDGTLVLSEGRNRQVWESFLGRYGILVDDVLISRLTGRRGADSLLALSPQLGNRSVPDLVAEFVEVETAIPLEIRAVPGGAELVRRLRAERMALGLVTSALRPYVTEVLAALGIADAFAATVSGEEVTTGKPDPEGFLAACGALDVDPASAVGIEDSPAGVAAVKAAGMACVGIATTHPRQSLDEADVVVDDYAHFEALGWPLLTSDPPGDGSARVQS